MCVSLRLSVGTRSIFIHGAVKNLVRKGTVYLEETKKILIKPKKRRNETKHKQVTLLTKGNETLRPKLRTKP